MCCLDNLISLLWKFESYTSITHKKRREFLIFQQRFNDFNSLLSKVKEGHLHTCTDDISCSCKEFIRSTPKEMINEIIDTIAVPYAMNFGRLVYLTQYSTCKYCIHTE